MSLKSVLSTIEGFVTKEVKAVEGFVSKVEAIEQKVVPEIKALMPELITLYNEVKAAAPQVEADINAVAVIIAEIASL